MLECFHAAESRGLTKLSWLTSFHSFSFAEFYDRSRMNFGNLRVLNNDRVQASAGFETHPHQDMEIITIVLSGSLAHKDTTGSQGVIHAGDVQRMSAGTGLFHSEMNASRDQEVHFLQIWIYPQQMGLSPSYEQASIDPGSYRDQWFCLVKANGYQKCDAPISMNQEAFISRYAFEKTKKTSYKLYQDEHLIYCYLLNGEVFIEEEDGQAQKLKAGDAVGYSSTSQLQITSESPADLLVFELLKK